MKNRRAGLLPGFWGFGFFTKYLTEGIDKLICCTKIILRPATRQAANPESEKDYAQNR